MYLAAREPVDVGGELGRFRGYLMDVGKDCPYCKAAIGIRAVLLAVLPSRIWCPHCSARLKYRDTTRVVAFYSVLAILFAGGALILSGAYRAFATDMPGIELGIRFTAFAVISLVSGIPVELAVAWFLQNNKELECISPPAAKAVIAFEPRTQGTPSDDTGTCPMCGATIKATAARCQFCGETLTPVNLSGPHGRDAGGWLFEPRSFIVIFLIIFFIVCPVSAAVWGIGWSWIFAVIQRRPFGDILLGGLIGGVLFGLIFGAVFGLVLAFLMKRDVRTLTFADRNAFVRQLNDAVAKIRYVPAIKSNDFARYRPRFGVGVAAGILVHVHNDQAVIIGPKANLTKLVQQFALLS